MISPSQVIKIRSFDNKAIRKNLNRSALVIKRIETPLKPLEENIFFSRTELLEPYKLS